MGRTPPLGLLRTFEAAARHGSFKTAADELHVTPAAVSQQIRLLEENLGVRLFDRLARGVVLTEQGRFYLAGVSDGLNRLGAATDRLLQPDLSGPLAISTLPSFASYWLIPRLPRFQARYGAVALQITAATSLVNVRQGEADVAIRFGRGNYPGVRAEHLMNDVIFPVCSPALLRGATPKSVRELLRYPLIHDVGVSEGEPWAEWSTWAREDGADASNAPSHLRLGDTNLVLAAAMEGQGIALARRTITQGLIDRGLLVRPLGSVSRPTDYAYYFVCSEDRFDNPKVVALRDWLIEEVGADNSLRSGSA